MPPVAGTRSSLRMRKRDSLSAWTRVIEIVRFLDFSDFFADRRIRFPRLKRQLSDQKRGWGVQNGGYGVRVSAEKGRGIGELWRFLEEKGNAPEEIENRNIDLPHYFLHGYRPFIRFCNIQRFVFPGSYMGRVLAVS